MKIFHPLLCYYPSQAGGPANTLYWLNSALDSSEFEAIVLSTDFGLDAKVSLDLLSVETSTPSQEVQFVNNKGKDFLKIGMKFISESDIVQFSSLFFPPTLPLLISAIFKGKKVIISPRGELYPAALKIKSFQKKVWLLLVGVFQKKIYFHATNEFESGIIAKYFPKAKGVSVIPNYVKMAPRYEMEVIKDQFLFIGRINPIKNIDVLIKSIAYSQKSLDKKLKLVIAGSARLPYEIVYEKQLKKLVNTLNLQDSVTFLGHIQGDDKDKLIASSFALVLPSQSENFGNVVLEALAQGTPVIASKNTPWESLKECGAGYWTESSVEEISNSIMKVINLSEIEYLQMRSNAYSLCTSTFDIESNVSVWENLYKKLLNF
ncbi:glycosyltransferase [Algoriphagus antarcticus]|uniref:Glycosyltransferase involved in cell wall biosynthesis n=1 Tax=Algoriphagus antarcticus TaxID=238540 RepID=A0A3E0D4J2_9BACT|nr:glycosyltransferase [Algoriphagus antarcticus]REG77484.1 glycosyltransferase involved in cell wall biosynthesis [Algoriphagus antarcticus]